MSLFLEKYFSRIFWLLCFLVFAIIALRAFMIPFSHDEVATFFYYIQSDNYLPYKAHVYTNNHVLNSALANICYHVAGSHRFVLRLPNIFAFLILCYGVWRHFRYLNTVFSKLVLVTFFILTLNFLDFFELCRGYGLSLGFMVLGLCYLLDYFKSKNGKYLLWFSVCWQLALAANLILVVVFTILLGLTIIFQLNNKLLVKPKTIVIQVINIVMLAFWIKFSFFYKAHNVLDAGAGDNYWLVTFKSLISWLFGTENLWMQILVIAGFCLIVAVAIWQFSKQQLSVNTVFAGRFFYPLMLLILIAAFYLQKKILHVNFPEDRTGLFFYVFFVLCLAFTINAFPGAIAAVTSMALLGASIFYFIVHLNFSGFSSSFYYTMPKAFYDQLKSEYDKTEQIFTIGGHRVRELNYAFLNYRGGAMLNHMDDAEQMYMNCDYYYAMKREKPYYQFFYDEIGYEAKWDHVLLKRKDKITRKEVAVVTEVPKPCIGHNEFFEFLRVTDTSFSSKNCLEAELAIKFNKVPKPLNAFIVLSIDDNTGKTVYYKRIALNMLADNLSGETKFFKLTTGQMPANFKSAVVYLWNIDQKDVDFTLKTLRINELYGRGINFKIPDTFYPLMETITKKSLL